MRREKVVVSDPINCYELVKTKEVRYLERFALSVDGHGDCVSLPTVVKDDNC